MERSSSCCLLVKPIMAQSSSAISNGDRRSTLASPHCHYFEQSWIHVKAKASGSLPGEAFRPQLTTFLSIDLMSSTFPGTAESNVFLHISQNHFLPAASAHPSPAAVRGSKLHCMPSATPAHLPLKAEQDDLNPASCLLTEAEQKPSPLIALTLNISLLSVSTFHPPCILQFSFPLTALPKAFFRKSRVPS